MAILDVCIPVFGRRLENLRGDRLPKVEGVRYVVTVQDPDGELAGMDLREFLGREDIELRIYRDRGLSRNRNHALEASTADFILIADDDLVFKAEALVQIINIFESDSELDFATFRATTPDKRVFPPSGWDLKKRYRFYFPYEWEMAFRRSAIGDLRYSELTGIGAPYLTAGEGAFFAKKVLNRARKARFYDVNHVEHPSDHTSLRESASAGFIRTQGAFVLKDRGIFGALARFGIMAHRADAPFVKALIWLMQGAVYAWSKRL